jgi:hypothetical protein
LGAEEKGECQESEEKNGFLKMWNHGC